MNSFIKNILNPPQKIEAGQIWYSTEYSRDFLVTEDKDGKDGLFKTVMLSTLTEELSDGINIILRKDKFSFLSTDKIAIRHTEGPHHKKRLDAFVGEIDKNTLQAIKKSLKNKSFEGYDENKFLLVEDFLNEANEIRTDSFELYESGLEKTNVVINLSDIVPKTVDDYITQVLSTSSSEYAFAADDINRDIKEFKFWETIEESDSTEIFNKPNEFSLELVKNEYGLFVVVYSETAFKIQNVSFEQNGKIIYPDIQEGKFDKSGRAFYYFKVNNFDKSNAIFTFEYGDGITLTREVIFE